MARHMTQMSGIPIDSNMLAEVELPIKLKPILVIHDGSSKPLCRGRDITELKEICSAEISDSLSQDTIDEVYSGFPDKGLSATINLTQGYTKVSVYQYLQPVENGYILVRSEHSSHANLFHKQSLIKILINSNTKLINELSDFYNDLNELSLRYATLVQSPYAITETEADTLFKDLLAWHASSLLDKAGLCYTANDFEAINAELRATIIHAIDDLRSPIEQTFTLATAIRKIIDKPKDLRLLAIASEIKTRLDELVFKGFISSSGESMLRSYPRYLKALSARLETAQEKPQRERQNAIIWHKYWSDYLALNKVHQSQSLRHTLEEFHVSLFAQHLGTKIKVSEKRLVQLFNETE